MSLLRSLVARPPIGSHFRIHAVRRPQLLYIPGTALSVSQCRAYASKKNKRDTAREEEFAPKGKKSVVETDKLIPGSQKITASEDYVKLEEKMKTVVEKYRNHVAELETRATGRVTPALLAPVRVLLSNRHSSDEKGVQLEEIATVGVREGTTLLVTVFEEQTLKFVEQGIYDAKLPGIIPQKVDSRTIKVPIPKPTVEARQALYTTAQRHAEEARVQVRRQHQASLKKGGFKKHSPEIDEFQKLNDKWIAEIDKILAEMKKSTTKK